MKATFAQAAYPENSYTTTYYERPSVPAKDAVGMWFTKVGIVSGMLSALFAAVIIYCLIRLYMLEKEAHHYRDESIRYHQEKMAEMAKNPRWELVENLLQSPVEADWRVAIIEADVLLEEALQSAGFSGVGVGEILTAAGEGAIANYQNAWNAHKIRNDIAHIGSSYKISREEAAKTVTMYRIVLEELGAI